MIEPEFCEKESLCNIKTNWTISESVRLVAAVIKSDPTRPNWENVSKLMSIQPEAKQRFRGFFSAENCTLRFVQLVDSFLTHTTDAWINTNKAEQLLKILASEALLEKSRQLEKNCLRAHEQHSCGWNFNTSSSNALDLSLNTESIFEDAVQYESPAESLTEDYFHFTAMNKSSKLVLAGPAAVARKSLPKNLVGEENLDESIRYFNFDELVNMGSNSSLDDDDVPYAERLQKHFPIQSKPKVDLKPTTSVKEKRKEQVPQVCLAFSQRDPTFGDKNELKSTTLLELQKMERKKSKLIYTKQSNDALFKKPFPPKKRYKNESVVCKTGASVTNEESLVDVFQNETTNKEAKEPLVYDGKCTEEQEARKSMKSLEETAVEQTNYTEMSELDEDEKDEGEGEEGCMRVLRSQRATTVPQRELPDRESLSADNNNIYPDKTKNVKDELMLLFGQAIAFTPPEFYHCSRIGFPEGISQAIKRPMDLMTIKKLLEEEQIKTIPSLDGNLSRTYYNGFMVHPEKHPMAQKSLNSMKELLTLFRGYRSNYLEGLGQEFQKFLETLGPITEKMVEESLCEMFGKERAKVLLSAAPLRQTPPTSFNLPRRSRELSPDITDLPTRKSKPRK